MLGNTNKFEYVLLKQNQNKGKHNIFATMLIVIRKKFIALSSFTRKKQGI